jgi:hypothetical protein
MNILFDINRNEAMLHLASHLHRVGKLDKALLVFNSRAEKERLSDFKHDFDITVRSEFYKPLQTEQRPPLSTIEDTIELSSMWQWVRGDRTLFYIADKGKFFLDKTRRSHYELQATVSRVYGNVFNLFQWLQPDLVLLTDVVNLSKYIIVELAFQRKIPTMFLLPVRIGKYEAFSNTPYEHFKFIYDRLNELRKETTQSEHLDEAEGIVFDILNKQNQYHDAAQMSGVGPTEKETINTRFIAKNYREAVSKTVRHLASRKRRKQTRKIITSAFTRPIEMSKVWLRRQYSLPRYKFDQPVDGEQYIFFPLHSEPETAISLNAPYIGNQAELTWNIATSIPIEMKLYVKDHPRMYGLRPVQYYERMRERSPNVRVLHPLRNTLDFVPSARLVIVVSGTTGLEALLNGIPVMTLGACNFQYLTGVTRTRNIALLPQTIRDALRNAPHPDAIKRDASLFVRACLDESFPIGWYSDIVNAPSDYDYSCQEFRDFCVYVERQIDRLLNDPGWLEPLRTGYTI